MGSSAHVRAGPRAGATRGLPAGGGAHAALRARGVGWEGECAGSRSGRACVRTHCRVRGGEQGAVCRASGSPQRRLAGDERRRQPPSPGSRLEPLVRVSPARPQRAARVSHRQASWPSSREAPEAAQHEGWGGANPADAPSPGPVRVTPAACLPAHLHAFPQRSPRTRGRTLAASRAPGADGATWWPWAGLNLYHQADPAVLRDPAAPQASGCLWACDQDPEGPVTLSGQLPGISCGPEGQPSAGISSGILCQQHQIL